MKKYFVVLTVLLISSACSKSDNEKKSTNNPNSEKQGETLPPSNSPVPPTNPENESPKDTPDIQDQLIGEYTVIKVMCLDKIEGGLVDTPIVKECTQKFGSSINIISLKEGYLLEEVKNKNILNSLELYNSLNEYKSGSDKVVEKSVLKIGTDRFSYDEFKKINGKLESSQTIRLTSLNSNINEFTLSKTINRNNETLYQTYSLIKVK